VFELPGIFLVLPGSILPMARKRKSQIGRSGLHILPHGMHYRRIAIFGVSTQDTAAQTRLASPPPMR